MSFLIAVINREERLITFHWRIAIWKMMNIVTMRSMPSHPARIRKTERGSHPVRRTLISCKMIIWMLLCRSNRCRFRSSHSGIHSTKPNTADNKQPIMSASWETVLITASTQIPSVRTSIQINLTRCRRRPWKRLERQHE